MNPRLMFIGGFVITAGMISYWDIHDCHELPWPPRIVATGFVFGMLDLFAVVNPELAGVLAIGFMLAMIVNTKIHSACKITKPQCGSQASDLVGIPPPKFGDEQTPTGPGPAARAAQEAPRGGNFLAPGEETPAIDVPSEVVP